MILFFKNGELIDKNQGHAGVFFEVPPSPFQKGYLLTEWRPAHWGQLRTINCKWDSLKRILFKRFCFR